MKIESKEFWQVVLDEYNNSERKNNYGICLRSKTFDIKWCTDRKTIKRWGKMFLIQNKITDFFVAGSFLFLINDLDTHLTSSELTKRLIEIRLKFINWCIKRFSNDTHKKGVVY